LNLEKSLKVLAFSAIFLLSSICFVNNFAASGTEPELPTQYPVLYVHPGFIQAEVDETFTISVIAYNLTSGRAKDPDNPQTTVPLGNLYGFDIQFTWDPTVIKYVNYTNPGTGILAGAKGYKHTYVTVPFEKYSSPIPPSPYAGILHGTGTGNQSTIEVVNMVNETGNLPEAESPTVRAWFSYAVLSPATPFNGHGTIFTMTFKVLKPGQSPLDIVHAVLADKDGNPVARGSSGKWLNAPRNGVYRTPGAPVADFAFSPSIGVVNKTMTFNATVSENITSIRQYRWDFGDGAAINTTLPTVDHIYNASGSTDKTVTLIVTDANGVESASVSRQVMVAVSRDLKARYVTVPLESVRPNRTFTIETAVENFGVAKFSFNETAIAELSYNSTAFDLGNLSGAAWVQIGQNQTTIPRGSIKKLTFALNSSHLPTLEANYYFLLNATGIPQGYELNTTNNHLLSTPLLYTEQIIHNPRITVFSFGYYTGTAYKRPVIQGENTTISATVKNKGNEKDTIDVTFYANGSILKSFQLVDLGEGKEAIVNWRGLLNPGNSNLTVVASAATVANYTQAWLKVIKPPHLIIEYSPKPPGLNQEVVFNASASIHQDPEGTIQKYSWVIYAPGVEVDLGSPTFIASGGANMSVISFALNQTGKWNIVLEVTDSYGFTYDARSRPGGTLPYRLLISVEVAAGFPWELVIGVVALIVVLIAVALLYMRRRRRAVIPPSDEQT
jgi:hypothetical protein